MKKVSVEIWSDFVCPWCWIAKRRFEKAVASLAGQVEVAVTSKAYRLAKGMPSMDYKSALYQKFGNPATADRMMAAVSETGLLEGLVYNFDTMRFGNTSAAHAVIKSIHSPMLAQLMIERVYKAATTDGLDIFDKDVLASLAREVGATEAHFQFESPQIAAEIELDEAEANSIANGVPLFLFNNKLYLSGAQEVGVFEKALLEAATDVPEPLDASEGESCGIDGCTL
ncbi:DsbA family oxidoreductase [Aeromonas caviae]|uniref:DsbA family oxidoreductase n=1 Tax=Aeromonas caviae TaxID=648 RepID=UPI0038D10750